MSNNYDNQDKYEKYVSDSVKDEDIYSKKQVHLLNFRDPDGCPLYEQIKIGNKTVEGRKNSIIYQKIKVGDTLLLSDRSKGILECDVTYVNLYADISEYIVGQGLNNVFGNVVNCRGIKNIQDGTNIYHEFVDSSQILDLKKRFGHGFLGIGIKFIREYKRYFETLNEPWFSLIRDEKKIVEGRLNKGWVKSLKPFDMIEFKRNTPIGENIQELVPRIEVIVMDVKQYKKFTNLFDDVGLENVLPDIKTYENGIMVYRQWYSEEKENEFGVVGIFIKVIKK